MFIVQNKEEAKNLINSEIKDGNIYNITIEQVKKLKTHKQLKFYFGGIVKPMQQYLFSIGYGINENKPYSTDMTHDIIFDEMGLLEGVQLPSGKIVYEPKKRLSEMTVDEAHDFITTVIDWVDTKTKCILPSFVRYCWLNSVTEEEIYRAQKYKFPERDSSYLNHIRSQPCIYSGVIGMSEAHHVRGVVPRSMNEKPPDWCCIPVTHKVHLYKPCVQFMPVEKLVRRIPTFGFNMEMFLRLCYLRWREHR